MTSKAAGLRGATRRG